MEIRDKISPRRPVVTLVSDFGHRDPFVGIMKGVILGICPEAVIVDLCHEVEAYDILGGSFLLQSAARFFPPGTIHVAVVDPGVGGARRPLLGLIGEQLFVAPDNGILSYSMDHGPIREVRAITASEYFLHPVSASFHGRDVFAPVAGHLAAGAPSERFGPKIADAVRLDIPRARLEPSGILSGHVIWIDRFGNCVTSITRTDLEKLPAGPKEGIRAFLGERSLGPVVGCFGDVGPGGRGGLVGSTGHLELFSNQGNLAREWGAKPGEAVRLEASNRPIADCGLRNAE
jgi:S-adenosylmethionine hydrolase